MPRIYVEFLGLNQIGNCCKAVALKVDAIQSDLQSTIRQLDWDVRFEHNINGTATQIVRKLDLYSRTLESYQRFIEDTCNEYIKLNEYEKLSLDGVISQPMFELENIIKPIILGPPGGNPFADWKNVIRKIIFDTDEEKDLISVVKTLLRGYDKWGDVDEAGVLEEVISYFENLTTFFSGDKKGLTGASDWCDLAGSSIGAWKGVYDYFCDTYKGLKTGFFGEVAQKNVKVLGVSSGFLALAASILSASNGLENKQWQSIVADYVDCGKDILSVIKSGYELKHIGDVKSLSEIKAGPWSALNIYTAIGEASIESISQGFRSHEKYYADGQWDMGDTGATGIDISMAGIYGISHSLTLGLDNLIFGAIDSATGGNGTTDMSYFEKAAEGYKILASKCGEAIGNWWINLTT